MHKVTTLALPTALLASSCAPWIPPPEVPAEAEPTPLERVSPSAAAHQWSDPPPALQMNLPSSGEAVARWLLPGRNQWAAYQKATLLTALDSTEQSAQLPDVEQLEEVARARAAAKSVAEAGLPPQTMWIVDLRGAASVAFGATLSSLSPEPIAPILTFHNWPADNETVPAEETLAALVTMQPRLPPAGQSGTPVFLLDAWRLTHRFDRPDDEATDNRYMLTASDLPDAAVVLARGIRRVLYVVDGVEGTLEEEDDLHAIFLEYQQAGIDVAVVGLDELMASTQPSPPTLYYGQSLVVNPNRITIISDPSFYYRARGGFGGTHVIHGGGSYSFGAHCFTFAGHGGG